MKKILILLLTIIAFNATAQLTPIPNFRIQNATTQFGIAIPKYATIYDYSSGTWYRTTAAIASTATITTASASLNAVSSAEVNDLSSSVTWETVPDAFVSQSSVKQHEAALSITEAQITDLTHFTNGDETDPVYSAWDKDYTDLINTPTIPTGNSVIDWTLPSQGTIDPTNYVDNNTTYTEAQLNQDDVTSLDVTTALGYTPYNATNPNGYITDGNTGWDNSYGFITGYTETDPVYSAWDKSTGISILENQITDLGTYLESVPANSVGYAEVATEFKQAVTNNTLAWDLAASGIIFSAVSSTGTISFTDYEINQGTIIRLTISGGATISWPSTAKIQEGSQTLGDGTFNISILPLSSTIFLVSISKDAA